MPYRQWVLSLPHRVRVLCAYDPDAAAAVRGVHVRAVSGFYERQAKRRGAVRPRGGAVAFVQRFDSALRVNVDLHVVWADGAFTRAIGAAAARFWEAAAVTDEDVGKLVGAIRGRVLRKLQRMGKWPAADGAGEEANGDVLQELGRAAVQGREALGERAGARDGREGRGTPNEPFVKGPLCAEVDGFSLHAGVRVEAGDRRRLEHLCRPAGRPAIAESRLSLLPDGRVRYALKRRWKDGTLAPPAGWSVPDAQPAPPAGR